MPNFFERRDVFGNSPAVWIFAAILFAIPFGTWSLSRLNRHDDASNWLFPGDTVRQTHEWAAETFPLHEDLLVTWKGSSLYDPRIAEFRRNLEPRRDDEGVLRGGKPQIARITDFQATLQRMLDGEVPAGEAVQRLTGMDLGPGPLCVRLTEDGRKRLRRIQSELPAVAKKQWGIDLRVMLPGEAAVAVSMAENATNLEQIVLSADGVLQENADTTHDLCLIAQGTTDRALVERLQSFELQGVTNQTPLIADLFYLPGRPIALSVTFTDAGRADRSSTLQTIRTVAADVGIPVADLQLIGPAVIEEDLRTATQLAGWNPAAPWQQISRRSALLMCVIAGVLLTVLLLRDVRLVSICLLCAGGAVFGCLALMPVVGSELSAWQYTTPVWLGAVALGCAIHVARQWQMAGRENVAGVHEALRQAGGMTMAMAGMLLIAVAGWCASPLAPIRDWGEVASIAVIAAALLVVLGVPSLLLLWSGKPSPSSVDPALWHTLAGWWSRRPLLQSIGTLAVIAGATIGLRQPRLELDLLHGLPAASTARQSIRDMESQLTGTMLSETIIRFDTQAQDERDVLARMELVREVAAQLRIHPAVTGCLSWADFFPVTEGMSADASRLESNRRSKLAQARQEEWRDDQGSAAGTYYAVAKKDRDAVMDGDRGYCQQGDELWRVSTRVRWANTAGLAQTQRELDDVIRGVLKSTPGTKHHLVGPLALRLRTEQLALRSFLITLGIAAGIVALLSIVATRTFGAGLLAVLPSAAPIAAVMGGWSWLGYPIDLTALLAASVALGISAGQIVPMLVAFQRSRTAGQSRGEAVRTMLAERGPCACRTAWIIGLMVLPLSTSPAWVIGHIGRLLPLMIAVGAVSQVMWLPQLLAGPLGQMFAVGPLRRDGTSVTDDEVISRAA